MLEIKNEHHFPNFSLLPRKKAEVYVDMPTENERQAELDDSLQRMALLEEEMNSEGIALSGDIDPDALAQSWNAIVSDLQQDPEWVDLSDNRPFEH